MTEATTSRTWSRSWSGCAAATTWSTATASRAAFARERCPGLHRWLGNPVLSFVGRFIYGTPCGDIYCGLRGFDRSKVIGLDIRSSGMEYAIEMLVKATMRGLRVTEVPTTLSPDAEGREPHLRTWRDGWRSIQLLLLYSPRWLFLYPGLLLLLAGIVGMAWLIPGQRTVGNVTFDVSTLLYFALAVVVGLESVYFFVLARWYGMLEGLLPDDPRLRRLMGRGVPEIGLLVGCLLVAAGLALSVYALATWNDSGFGRLDYPHTLRIVVPGATLITCGMQTALASLLRRRARPQAPLALAGDRPQREAERERHAVERPQHRHEPVEGREGARRPLRRGARRHPDKPAGCADRD